MRLRVGDFLPSDAHVVVQPYRSEDDLPVGLAPEMHVPGRGGLHLQRHPPGGAKFRILDGGVRARQAAARPGACPVPAANRRGLCDRDDLGPVDAWISSTAVGNPSEAVIGQVCFSP